MENLIKLSKKIEMTEYELSKMAIFKYDTLDEADPGLERIRSDITVEIGGPSAHIKFTVWTREEHTIVKKAVQSILNNRMDNLKEELYRMSKKIVDVREEK